MELRAVVQGISVWMVVRAAFASVACIGVIVGAERIRAGELGLQFRYGVKVTGIGCGVNVTGGIIETRYRYR
jgi:hypothetical protein